jgi:hypothetical protein
MLRGEQKEKRTEKRGRREKGKKGRSNVRERVGVGKQTRVAAVFLFL